MKLTKAHAAQLPWRDDMSFRWKLWEWASWLAWWLCPDKKALALIMKHGSETSRAAMAELKRQRDAQEGNK